MDRVTILERNRSASCINLRIEKADQTMRIVGAMVGGNRRTCDRRLCDSDDGFEKDEKWALCEGRVCRAGKR